MSTEAAFRRHRNRRTSGLLSLLLFACTDGSSFDSGRDAALSVSCGTFYRGTLPKDNSGPSVQALYLARTSFTAGYVGKSFSGVLDPQTVAVAIALEDDVGYWSIDAQAPSPEAPNAPTFHTALSFSKNLSVGAHVLDVWAIDTSGHVGTRRQQPFTIVNNELPVDPLVIQLTWDVDADLDLSVVTPSGTNISSENPSSVVTVPGEVSTATSVGQLDHDSNKNCSADGLRDERISFEKSPEGGNYHVYVTAASLCDEVAAHYRVNAYASGSRVGSATGEFNTISGTTILGRAGRTWVLDVDMP
jgi:hypothetical protein